MWLERLGCDPVDDSDKLVTAVMVCSMKVEEIIPTLQDPWLAFKLRVWRWRLGKFDAVEKIKLFHKYIEEGTRTPSVMKLHQTDDAGGSSGTPFLEHLKVSLQAKLNYSPSEAINAPFTQAIFDYYCYHELEGNLEICDRDHRREMFDLAESQREEILAAINKQKQGSN